MLQASLTAQLWQPPCCGQAALEGGELSAGARSYVHAQTCAALPAVGCPPAVTAPACSCRAWRWAGCHAGPGCRWPAAAAGRRESKRAAAAAAAAPAAAAVAAAVASPLHSPAAGPAAPGLPLARRCRPPLTLHVAAWHLGTQQAHRPPKRHAWRPPLQPARRPSLPGAAPQRPQQARPPSWQREPRRRGCHPPLQRAPQQVQAPLLHTAARAAPTPRPPACCASACWQGQGLPPPLTPPDRSPPPTAPGWLRPAAGGRACAPRRPLAAARPAAAAAAAAAARPLRPR